ncbi:hypothetical protein [Clostridioides sp. ES-W-0016-02]|uniref:hypothetical protein n=1 Tax=Clostridioides sp. ES-W-0016-02 TaxID=2770788 RepID=UPI001D12C465|nr:hypothetical protein IC758_14215 [Clostridioides sp. ES-W-0016-02]
MRKYEIFIFVNIIFLCFISFPHKVFGQEDNCLEDFKIWYQENKNNTGEMVYTLSCDMVIDEEYRFFTPDEAKLTIDTNKYKILIKDQGNFIIQENELNIVGEGGEDGVIHVEKGGRLNIGIDNIIATNGTALYIEEGGYLRFSSYYESIGNIRANGNNAIGIYSENDIRVPYKDIEVRGKNAVGVYCKGDIELESTSVRAYDNDNKTRLLRSSDKTVKSIVSKSKNIYIIDSYNEFIPAISEDSGYNIVKCCHRGINVFSEEIKVSKDDKIENIKFPKDMVLETSSSNQIDIDVEWDFTDYYEKLKKEENFSITGKFKTETLNKEKIIINDDVVPILNISVIEKKPIDNLELEFQNTRNGYVAALYYDMPYSASKVFVEYSSDGINWISEEQEDIRDQAILFFEDFKLRCFRVRVEGGLKEGYSNIVFKPGFIMGGGDSQETPDDERENDDIDGDRGGGGRDDPDREDSEIIGDTNDNNENEAIDKQRPEDSNKDTESNDEEKDNKLQQDEKKDKSDEKDIKTENETNKNINNQDKNFKSNDLIMKNKIESSLKEILTESHNENYKSPQNTFNDDNALNREDTSEVGKFNDKLDSPSQSQNKTQNFNSGIIIGIGIVVLSMLCSIIAVNPGIIKHINKFIKFK